MTRTASVHWRAELRFSGESGAGALVELDSSGSGAFRPTELLLAALAGCTAMDVIAILAKKRQAVARYEVTARGEQVDTRPAIFRTIEVEHVVEGPAIDPEAVRRSIELSATRYCPVSAHLSAGEVEIAHRYIVRSEAGELRADVVVTGPRGRGLDPEIVP